MARLIEPLDAVTAAWPARRDHGARNLILAGVHHRQLAWWAWNQETWAALIVEHGASVSLPAIALGQLLGHHRRLHYHANAVELRQLADLVFGVDVAQPAIDEVRTTLAAWEASQAFPGQIVNTVVDLLLTSGSPRLRDVTEEAVSAVLSDNPTRSARRLGLFKVSRVLAERRIISRPLNNNEHHRGNRASTLADVPGPWLDWALRWRKLARQEPSTAKVMFSPICIAGRWTAEKHPEAVSPDLWTRDIAAEYVADTMHAKCGDWAGHNRNKTNYGRPLAAPGMANRIDSIRGFFCDLIEFEWIEAKFDPRRVLSLPISLRAQMKPNPRIIDDASWAKLTAAGLTLNSEDLKPYGTPASKAKGQLSTYYPIEMLRALVGVWLFAGCRIDEIHRLELDCIFWDTGNDPDTGEQFTSCLLRVPANKTSGAFTKPVDPVVGQLIDAWKLVRPAQPDLPDRKTRQPRQHLFTWRGQLIGKAYLNDRIIPALCGKANIPESDSRGALTSHRARATIATQLLNAREPLTLADLQQWLGHKHAASTRYYGEILQRTLSAAYRTADYFTRNVRTIQVLIDRESILTGTAAGGEQPWKYYDLGDGYCSYDFFAKCPHRLACAKCSFYLPKQSNAGQLLAVKDGIDQMLEQLDLTDDERAALEGDREALTALANRLADVATPSGPTSNELGNGTAFIPLTALRASLREGPP